MATTGNRSHNLSIRRPMPWPLSYARLHTHRVCFTLLHISGGVYCVFDDNGEEKASLLSTSCSGMLWCTISPIYVTTCSLLEAVCNAVTHIHLVYSTHTKILHTHMHAHTVHYFTRMHARTHLVHLIHNLTHSPQTWTMHALHACTSYTQTTH